MAKLKAYGQTEVARFVRENEMTSDTLISWQREVYAVMSSGRVLLKRDVQFRSDGRKHSYGWKVNRLAGSVKGEEAVARFARGVAGIGFVAVPHHGKWGLEPAYVAPAEVA